MSDQKTPDPAAAAAAAAATTDPKAPKAKVEKTTVRLKHPIAWDGELSVDRHSYPVKGGVVEVPAEHVPHAQQSGFLAE